MKKIQKFSLFLAAAAIVGCNGLGKMAKNASTAVKYEVTPNPLEMHGDSVAISVKGTYAAKYYAKKVALTITPALKTSAGDKQFKPLTTGGEKSKANGQIIPNKTGGSFTYTDKIAYTPDMRAADVMVQIKGAQGKKVKDFTELKIADATITTPLLVKADEKAIAAKDAFVRITPVKFDGTIFYLVNTAKVNDKFNIKKIGVDNKTQFAMIDSMLKMYNNAPYTMKGIDIMGNASPDGKLNINTPLAENRGKSSQKYFMDKYKKNKMNADSALFHMSSTSEDWPGFQKLMNESDIPMKDVILRICASNSDPEAREMEIKKMSKAYTEIKEKIMPKLRKSDITFNADKVGRSDEQISALALANPDSLSVEEILYAGKLTDDMDKKMQIYKSAERIYPQDWRGSNNLGTVLFAKKNVTEAMAEFEKADALSKNNPIVMNNLGACYRQKGDRKKAAEMYSGAAGAGAELNENMAILDILNGNYATAVSNCGDAKTFNCALAKLLAGDKDGAMSTLEASADKDSAPGYYLKAVISARKGEASGVVGNLKSSIAKDGAMKAYAKEDREFIKWFKDADFKGATE